MSQGDRGLRVNDLQQALGLLGYELVQDGIFGPQTQQKLLVFQEDHGLPVSGRLDKATAEKLNHALNQQGITEPVGIKAAHPPTQGYWVAVNKSTNRLLLFQGERAIADYPVASRKNASLTPEGQFKIVFKAIDPAWGGAGIAPPVAGGHPDNPLESRWLGLDIGGGGTYGIHGTNNPANIGTYASLGCVRMHNHDVEYLYELLPEHTPVWIGSTQQLENWGIR
ncbi:L,D-transpeptidase family protein [Caldalkalibacillus thermarum]|uniref:L,D-transpeptidase family protein n=1 Tax=Caldalkalibacillus thermarum TaxID=296745 RepID=UPI00227B608B|nr:L,D-transpeptidase family protein [Caldalkalibacillus thermarum]